MTRSSVVVAGVVATPKLLVASGIGGPDGRRPFRVARTDDGREHLVAATLAAGSSAIAVPEPLARGDPLVPRAVAGGLVVWIVPAPLVDAIVRAALLRAPERIAAAIARLPAIPYTRGQLRRLIPDHDRRQLKLL